MNEARGYVNAHTHLYSGLAPLGMPAALPEPRSFVEILERVWWRLDRALDETTLRAAARYYLRQALLLGTTSLIDHHESPSFIDGSLDVLADACQEMGLRAVLCYGATERNGGREEAEAGLAECRRFLVENDRPLVTGVVGLHASFTVGDDSLREAAELCQEFQTVMHVHLAEDAADVEDARRRGAVGPLERLLAMGCLPPGSILAHGVCLDEAAVRECVRRELWLVQNPRSNTNNGVGHPQHLAQSERVALGTDGFTSNMLEEQSALLALPLVELENEGVRRARLAAGHRLIAERFGEDVTAADRVHFDGGRCMELVVASERVVQDGQLRGESDDDIVAEAKVAANRLWQRMKESEREES
jgi:cytosine/adenosine deaminase-related metal-dependent hydrolase